MTREGGKNGPDDASIIVWATRSLLLFIGSYNDGNDDDNGVGW
jgi:hypothetical protein